MSKEDGTRAATAEAVEAIAEAAAAEVMLFITELRALAVSCRKLVDVMLMTEASFADAPASDESVTSVHATAAVNTTGTTSGEERAVSAATSEAEQSPTVGGESEAAVSAGSAGESVGAVAAGDVPEGVASVLGSATVPASGLVSPATLEVLYEKAGRLGFDRDTTAQRVCAWAGVSRIEDLPAEGPKSAAEMMVEVDAQLAKGVKA